MCWLSCQAWTNLHWVVASKFFFLLGRDFVFDVLRPPVDVPHTAAAHGTSIKSLLAPINAAWHLVLFLIDYIRAEFMHAWQIDDDLDERVGTQNSLSIKRLTRSHSKSQNTGFWLFAFLHVPLLHGYTVHVDLLHEGNAAERASLLLVQCCGFLSCNYRVTWGAAVFLACAGLCQLPSLCFYFLQSELKNNI